MALDETFARAFLHDLAPDFDRNDPWTAHRVLGEYLRPFCLWHRFLLEAIDSPLLSAGWEMKPIDLKRAVWICRARFRECVLPERLTFRDHLRTAQRSRFAAEMTAFNRYVEDFGAYPDFTIKTREGMPTPPTKGEPAPETFRRAAELIGWTGWDDWRVWELPLSEANWYLSESLRERCIPLGTELDYMTPELRQLQEEMATQNQGGEH